MNRLLLVFALLLSGYSWGQSYAPAPGSIGSTAIHKDSSVIIDWATGVSVNRGPMNITNLSAGLASYGIDSDGLGPASGSIVVSLGDGGEAIITFDAPIVNGSGPDFAIFENGFDDNYIELAFVEVSSDGVNYYRFDAVSETPTDIQTTNFSFTDCRNVHNLAGKYKFDYGTPFDLQDLIGITGLNVNQITHVKIIDVIGSIDPLIGTMDSQGNIINDPFPTEFESSGFDLDAVAVIHSATESIEELNGFNVSVYPNPSYGMVTIDSDRSLEYHILDIHGREVLNGMIENSVQLNLNSFDSGLYTISFTSENSIYTIKLNLQ